VANGAEENISFLQNDYTATSIDQDGNVLVRARNGSQAVQALNPGQVVDQAVQVQVADSQGASSTANINVTLTGTDDVPTFVGGVNPVVLDIQEGGQSVNTQVIAFPGDQQDTRTWTVTGAAEPPHPADYTFHVENFKVWRSPNGGAGATIFEDDFNSGGPPPFDPPNPSGGFFYGTGATGTFTEAAGSLVLDSDAKGNTSGIGTATPFIGQILTLVTNNSSLPTEDNQGLKITNDFTVGGTFKLVFPDDLREGFGIRLTDSLPSVPGNDTLALQVRMGANGIVQVQLRDFNPAGDTVVNLAAFDLPPAFNDGEHSIALRLMHAAGSNQIIAGFDILDSGDNVVQTFTFPQTGVIFNGESWTRAQIVASAPETTDSYFEGDYGTLSVDQFGNVSYALRNNSAEVNALAQGQVEQDEFDVVLTDQTGASATKHVVVNVTGVNDIPVLTLSSGPPPVVNAGWGGSAQRRRRRLPAVARLSGEHPHRAAEWRELCAAAEL
jgi:VCBS repeat-containing protein